MIYFLLSAFASVFSGLKVIEKRRQLQETKPYKVTFTEALIHTLFDTTDKISNEWRNVNQIIDQRKNQGNNMLTYTPKQPLMLTYKPTNHPRQVVTSIAPNFEQGENDPTLIASIPDNRIQK
ncbi:hypothetical protein AKO1_014416 [Acrasis kona]|uniref:Uncharacterized protein n=1 Tax=Acrasis kona TaxID=1008807 RepID=A0AAW2YZU3_9EUKA